MATTLCCVIPLTMHAAGQFVVGCMHATNPGVEYLVRRYNADGSVAGPATVVLTTPYGTVNMALALDGGGNFVITFSEFVTSNISDIDVYARRYDAAGVALGSSFRVNTLRRSAPPCVPPYSQRRPPWPSPRRLFFRRGRYGET